MDNVENTPILGENVEISTEPKKVRKKRKKKIVEEYDFTIKTRLLRIEKGMLENVKMEAARLHQSSHSFILIAIEEKLMKSQFRREKLKELMAMEAEKEMLQA